MDYNTDYETLKHTNQTSEKFGIFLIPKGYDVNCSHELMQKPKLTHIHTYYRFIHCHFLHSSHCKSSIIATFLISPNIPFFLTSLIVLNKNSTEILTPSAKCIYFVPSQTTSL